MATNRVQARRSSLAGVPPQLADLLVGELALNFADKAIFMRTNTEVVQLNAAANVAQDSSHRFVTDAQIASWEAGYTLPVATAAVLGGVKIGANIDVDIDGVISLKIASATETGLLSSSSFSAFAAKQDALGFTPVNVAGDTMSGPLVLSGAPTLGNGAATKTYVDDGLATKLDLAGGTMTDLLVLSADPVQGLGAATKQYVDNSVSLLAGEYASPVQSTVDLAALNSSSLQDKQMRLVEDAGAIFRFDAQSVATADGIDVIIPIDAPATGRWVKVQAATQNHEALKGLLGGAANDHLHLTTAEKNSYDAHLTDVGLHLTTEQNTWLDAINASAAEVNYLVGVTSGIQAQLDAKQNDLGYVPVNRAGDTMQGPLILQQDPVVAMEAVTKQFLEAYVIDAGVYA